MRRAPFLQSLGVRLFAVFIVLLIPLAVNETRELVLARRRSEAETRQSLSRVAHSLTLETRSLFSTAHGVLATLSQMDPLRFGPREETERLLHRVHRQFDEYTNFSKVDRRGFIVASSTPMDEPVDVSDAVNIRNAFDTGTLSLSRFVIGPLTGKPVIVFSQPLLDPAGDVIGTVNTGLSLDWLGRYLADTGDAARHNVVFFDNRGTVLAAHPSDDMAVGDSIGATEFVRRARDVKDGTFRYRDGDRQMLAGVASMSQVPGGLYVSASMAWSAVLADFRNALVRHVVGFVVTVAACGIAVMLLSRQWFLRPIDALIRRTTAVANEQLEAGPPWQPNPLAATEIRHLAAAVEETAARLLERNRQISQAEEHLRQEVEDRTAELRGANASLRREITMRAAVESKLRESLAEKELLIREIHHRVKNNLQIVSSILHMQESAVSDSVAATAFADCEQRIRAMSMVHEQLHGSDTVTDINLDAYVSTLVHSITSSHGNEKRNVSVRVDMAGPRTNIDRAIPIGMIVNELVSNSLKHGYPNGTGGSITVALKRDGRQRTIVVQDDGVGLPDAVLPLVPENPSQLGLQLVQALAEQLHGTVEIRHGNGAEFRIRFQGLSPENGQDQRRGAGEQDT